MNCFFSKNFVPKLYNIIINLFIRRYTTVLAKQAEHVTAVDFIEKFIEKNRELNKNFKNIDFLHGDATQLKFNKNS
jgi:phosphoethanolamine N-methyltransferase